MHSKVNIPQKELSIVESNNIKIAIGLCLFAFLAVPAANMIRETNSFDVFASSSGNASNNSATLSIVLTAPNGTEILAIKDLAVVCGDGTWQWHGGPWTVGDQC